MTSKIKQLLQLQNLKIVDPALFQDDLHLRTHK